MTLGRTYRLTTKLLGYTDVATGIVASGINTVDNSATFIISTVKPDREGDVMVPEGCKARLASYRANPVVLYEHDQKTMAIGLSTSPDGRFSVVIEPGRILATCWYHLKTKESRDCWRGVQGGWMRGASIGFVPHVFEQMDPRKGYRPGDDGQLRRKPGYLHSEWELSEWSNVVLPMNDEALRVQVPGKTLAALGKTMGREVESRLIRKSLTEAGYPVPGIWSPGVTIAKGSAVANLRTRYSTKAHKSKERVVKAFARQGVDPAKWLLHKTAKSWVFVQKSEADDEEPKPKKEDTAADRDGPPDKDPDVADGSAVTKEEEPVKLGAQALADVHRHHTGLSDYIDTMRPHIDNEAVMKELDEHHAGAVASAEKVKAAAGEHYPDVDFDKLSKPPEAEKSEDAEETTDDTLDDDVEDEPLDDEDEPLDEDEYEEEEEEEDEKEPAKSARIKAKKLAAKRLRINKSGQMCVKEAGEFLDEVGAHEQVPKSMRIAAGYHSKQLTGMLQSGEDQGQDNGMGGEQAKEEEEATRDALEKALKVFSA